MSKRKAIDKLYQALHILEDNPEELSSEILERIPEPIRYIGWRDPKVIVDNEIEDRDHICIAFPWPDTPELFIGVSSWDMDQWVVTDRHLHSYSIDELYAVIPL